MLNQQQELQFCKARREAIAREFGRLNPEQQKAALATEGPLLLLAGAFIMLKYTKFGRSIYAVGGNEQSALMMGLNVRRVKLKAYMLDGFLCGVGSILFCLNTLGGFVEQAKGFEMDAIASAVIGGTLLTGGVGNVIGTLFGVLIKATIEAFITFQGTLSSWWTRITIAALLCFFIVLQSVLAMLKKLGRFCAFVGKVDDDFIWTAVPSCGRGGRHLHGLPRSRPRSPYYPDLCQEVRQRGSGFLFLPQSQRGYDA